MNVRVMERPIRFRASVLVQSAYLLIMVGNSANSWRTHNDYSGRMVYQVNSWRIRNGYSCHLIFSLNKDV